MAVIVPSFPEDHFTRVPNAWLRDPNLPPGPKAYVAYLLSHSGGFRCSTSLAARDMGVGRDTVSGWNGKLLERGYFVTVEQTRSARQRFAENDYTLTTCTAAVPALPENPALPGLETAGKSTVSGNPTRSTVSGKPRTENTSLRRSGEKTIPAPTEQGAGNGDGRHLVVVDGEDRQLREKLAQQLAAEHYEATGKLGGQRGFLAARGIVAGALEAGHAEQQIRAALAHLRTRGRPVTNSTLGPLLADPRTVTSSPYGPRQHIPTDPDAHRGAF